MKYIKVFAANNVVEIQKQVNNWAEQHKHNILDQSCSVTMSEHYSTLCREYLLTVTFDDGE